MGLHRRRVWEIAKGFRGRAKNCIKIARQQAEKALQHAYTDRRNKKVNMRALWNQRINAATREHGVSRQAGGHVRAVQQPSDTTGQVQERLPHTTTCRSYSGACASS